MSHRRRSAYLELRSQKFNFDSNFFLNFTYCDIVRRLIWLNAASGKHEPAILEVFNEQCLIMVTWVKYYNTAYKSLLHVYYLWLKYTISVR
ncbi:hypothetical protein HNQ71_006940 [Mesorhizobium sangaii]|uniref:Uncharacterized protein n=1 Tax=Mesorhizobium sangaii TaxID=505389 RepID=A0A841PJP1_9HYPH|nr:hypothetical protein [Mesorhizobium sangaii]